MTPTSIAKGALSAIGAFVLLGTAAALWDNPFFIRMTPTRGFEVGLLAFQAALLGVLVAIPVRACAVKLASFGGVANFIGVACPICNKLLLLVFGASALLTYLEPARVYLAIAGVTLTSVAVAVRWRSMGRPQRRGGNGTEGCIPDRPIGTCGSGPGRCGRPPVLARLWNARRNAGQEGRDR